MKLVIFNGSPRKHKSNSAVLIGQFLDGYSIHKKETVPVHFLAQKGKMEENIRAFNEANTILIIFPLYTDAMPGQVMAFFEKLEQLNAAGKQIGFIVQSGFPEAYHSIFIERYLEKLAKRMQCNYLGTIIRGGVEGIQIMPNSMTRKLFRQFVKLGADFATNGQLNEKIIKELKQPYRLSQGKQLMYRIMSFTGLSNYYWNMKLKENKAYEKRYDKPYI